MIVSALSGDCFRETFNSILDLVPKAEKLKQLHAICKLCQHQASYTLRTISSDNIEHIGGGEAYMPACRECYFAQMAKQARAKPGHEVSEVTYGVENGSPEDPAKLIVSY